MHYHRAKRAGPGLLCVSGLLSIGVVGCGEAWERYWESRTGSSEPPAADGGRAGDAGAERACGTEGGSCGQGEYCEYPEAAACGRGGEPGVCTPVPEVCTLELRPVCGCDGLTYSNPCAAAQARISVERDGECPVKRCGGYAGVKCLEDEYCDLAEGQGCGVADASGICKPRPRACTREYAPVCGCNDFTYDNACLAAADGMTVRAAGDCGPVQ